LTARSAIILVLLLLVSRVGSAGDIKLGFVDIPFLIDEAPQAHAASSRLEREFAPRQAIIKQQKAELEVLRSELDSTSLDNAERATKEREYRKIERRMKRDEQEFREELNIQKNNEFKKVRILVLEAIGQFGEQHDYDLIVSDGVLYANKRIDVTERILESLAKEYSSLQSSN